MNSKNILYQNKPQSIFSQTFRNLFVDNMCVTESIIFINYIVPNYCLIIFAFIIGTPTFLVS